MALDAVAEQLLTDYTQGALDPAHALLASAWLEINDEARDVARRSNTLSALLVEQARETPVSSCCLQAVLQRIATETDAAAPFIAAASSSAYPSAIQVAFCGQNPDAIRWRKLGKVRTLDVMPRQEDTRCQLVACPADRILPEHTHKGHEFALVLKGAFSDVRGTFARGSLAYADHTVQHAPQTVGDEDCICLIVRERDIHFTGRFSGLMNAAWPLLS